MCDSNINGNNVGYANELETNEYQYLNEKINSNLNGINIKKNMSDAEKEVYQTFIKKIKALEETYKGDENKTKLLYYKNKAYREYMNTREQYAKSYLQSTNVNPKDDTIKLTDQFPRRREELMDEQRKRHYYKLNTDWNNMGKNKDVFLEKYDWLNKMGKPLKLPDDFGLLTDNDEILEYRKQTSGRMPQDILTDYNPMIMGSQRLMHENVSRGLKKPDDATDDDVDANNNSAVPDEYFLKPYTEEEYNKYLDEISEKDYTKKYYEILGLE
jgi:hypothetical protein